MIYRIKSFFSSISRPLKQYLFHFSAFAGLFAGTARCPVCGQTLCPTGTTGMGLLALVFAFFTSRFSITKRPHNTYDPLIESSSDRTEKNMQECEKVEVKGEAGI